MNLEVSEKRKWIKLIFLGFAIFSLIILVMFILAIIFYPGGNIKDHTTTNFNFLWNTMCDLGADLSLNGESNVVSQIFFRIGMILYLIIFIIFFSTLWLFFKEKKVTKILSSIGLILIVLAGVFYVGVICTIGMHPLHNTILIFAPLFEFLAIILYTIIIFRDKRFLNLNRYTFLVMSILAITYMILAISGALVRGDFNLLVQRLGHTIFNFTISTCYVLQGIGAYLSVKKMKGDLK